jgi:hypothetical protein
MPKICAGMWGNNTYIELKDVILNVSALFARKIISKLFHTSQAKETEIHKLTV